MKIDKNAFVSIEYTLTLNTGEEVDRSEPGDPLEFIYGVDGIVPGLERQLLGMEVGQTASLVVSPEEGYGTIRPEMFQEIPKNQFPSDVELEVGMIFQSHSHHGPVHLRIREIKDDVVVGDLNHPLAGETLNFAVKVAGVRAATEEEILQSMQHSCSPSDCSSCGGGGCHEH